MITGHTNNYRGELQAEVAAQTTQDLVGGAIFGKIPKNAERDGVGRDLPAISARITEASAHVNKLAFAAMKIADRLYGSRPEAAGNNAELPPCGSVQEAGHALDGLDRNLSFLSDQLERLTRL